ncbi:hypothetical protein ATO7_09972 [Oceanococcus atlanticus]|uniref:Uncharacterized protein n=1 Tax=Oceanococcus atlanticus TaxID=1317117 RepID=A0A1Y1SEE3_9GAMM|nr:DUF493 domain-containing protein [Oceanococcus atlanticus]ORE87360.1 hypothetical protein ATO7_09972 [Oceanococcus atlanticus]RZO87102.1 MAG: DUF493 domain-containing protein [Oceanococcus sp.]
MSLHAALQELDYPCTYPFKLICQPDAVETVRQAILKSLGDGAEVTDVHQRASRNGRFVSLTVTITAQSAAQIETVYADLAPVPGIVTSL